MVRATDRGLRSYRCLAALALALLIVCSCTSKPSPPPVDPKVEVVSTAFAQALRARDLAKLQEFFAPTVLVVDTSFAGLSVKGTALSRDELSRWYAAMFEEHGPSGWSAVMENRLPELNLALQDGHHVPFAKSGDYVLSLVRPASHKLEIALEFAFRRISGQYKLVGQSKVFE